MKLSKGIYILANDVVLDQMIALINSIEINVSSELPICIIPYDDRVERLKRVIEPYSRITLFDNFESIQRWEDFAHRIWSVHPRAFKSRLTRPNWYKGHLQRKFVAFDGFFDRFVFYEADNLAMRPIEDVFEKLETHDLVFDDWEHRKPPEALALNIPLVEQATGIPEKNIRLEIHDASFWGARKGLFSAEKLSYLQHCLIENREIKWINNRGWWDDMFLFNYLTFKANYFIYNFTLSPQTEKRTGNCADADPFVSSDNVLYNQQGLKPIHRIHYMNYPTIDFTRLCRGEDVAILYRDIFLHYRFLKEPEFMPKIFDSENLISKLARTTQGTFKKLQKIIQ